MGRNPFVNTKTTRPVAEIWKSSLVIAVLLVPRIFDIIIVQGLKQFFYSIQEEDEEEEEEEEDNSFRRVRTTMHTSV